MSEYELQQQSNGHRYERNSAGNHSSQHMGNSGYHASHNTNNYHYNYARPNSVAQDPRRRISYRQAPTDGESGQDHIWSCETLLHSRSFWFVAALLAAVIILAIVLSTTLTRDSRSPKEGYVQSPTCQPHADLLQLITRTCIFVTSLIISLADFGG